MSAGGTATMARTAAPAPGVPTGARVRLTAIRVISMARDTERRAAFTARAAGAGVEWSFFDARTQMGPDLVYDPTTLIIEKGRELLPGERGNFASHFALWEELLASEFDQYIVLEDDAWVEWPYLARLAGVRIEDHAIGYLNLIVKRLSHFKEVGDFGERSLVQFMGYTHGTSYVVSRELAARHLEHFRVVRGNFDNMLDRSWMHGIPNYCVYPLPVLELGYKIDSQIGNGAQRFATTRTALSLKLRRKLHERRVALRRLRYILGQHLRHLRAPFNGPATL